MLMNRLEDIMPNFWDNDFEPLSCGIIEIWKDSSCNERLKLYSSAKLGDTELSNPYHLTSSGRPKTPIYFEEDGAFVVVKDKDDAPIKSYEYETSSILQGNLTVKKSIEAGENLVSLADTIVNRNLNVKGFAEIDGYAKIGGDITAENATIKNKTATKELNTETLKATVKAIVKDIDVEGIINVLGSILVNGATLDKIEIKKSMKFGALNVFVGQIFNDEAIVNDATYIRCRFTKLRTLTNSVSNVKFICCHFDDNVKLDANSYNSLHIEDCVFADGKKIDLTNPACVFTRCKIRRNESLGGNPFVPINMDLEGALFKIEEDGTVSPTTRHKKYKLQTNLISTDYLLNNHYWYGNFVVEVDILDSGSGDAASSHYTSISEGKRISAKIGSLGAIVVGIEPTDYDEIYYIKFIPCGMGIMTHDSN
jgi:hypothetical protein